MNYKTLSRVSDFQGKNSAGIAGMAVVIFGSEWFKKFKIVQMIELH
jgi:hypothetical protein